MAIYKWCCDNEDCKMLNLAEQEQIDAVIFAGRKPWLVCANCGIVHRWVKKGTTRGANWLGCIPFEGWESRLPLAKNPDGTITDSNGKHVTPEQFILANGIDANIYLKWLHAAKPKPENTC